MTQTDATTDRTSLVPGAHRVIRAIDGKEGPFAGSLITYEEGVAVCVNAERLTQWPGWAFSDADHVCGVLDLRRRDDGHDALLPWCTGRVESFLGRRQIADAPLAPGELGTLVASVLRGIRELGSEDSGATGDWWLTNDGRPLFVHGEGGEARARTAHLVERSAQHTSDRATIRVLEDITVALRRPRHHVEDDRRWEEELFAIAAPRALRLDVFAPESAGGVSAGRVAATLPASLPTRRATRRQERTEPHSARWARLTAAVREHAADLITGLRRRAQPRSGEDVSGNAHPNRRTKSSRPRALVLAGALGVVVLLVGLMWPSAGETDEAEAASGAAGSDLVAQKESSRESAAADRKADDAGEGDNSGTTEPAPTPSDSVEEESAMPDSDALGALPVVLVALADCAEITDESCAAAVTKGARVPSEGLVLLGPEASSAVLVEDYGDVAVVRLTPNDSAGTEQMLVMERQNERWLLRGVYDVAQQPA